VLALWRRAGLIEVIGDDAIFETLSEAVASARGRARTAIAN
jgi:hypothetical protein